MNTASLFHPAVSAWFDRTFAAPTPAQADAWPAIRSGSDVLIAAPTGSGKTLAAFLAAIDELVREGEQWGLPDETRIVYVSPLKALSNDINRNLEAPLAGIREQLRNHTVRDVEIRTWVRTGDTPQYERAQMRRKPPHIVVTTPESLYILLGSQSGREMLATTRTVIVDEIHAVAGSKRGSHLALSLERLDALTGRRPTRVGLSATQQPIEDMARFLVGQRGIREDGNVDCKIIDSGHVRRRDLALELPDSPLEAVMSNEVWTQVYDRLAQLIREHRTTLVFVNTRRLAERVCRHLSERLDGVAQKEAQEKAASGWRTADGGSGSGQRPAASGQPASSVAAHHGSLARDLRFDAEQRLKRGELKALVATASLELGIDIGDVDLVCQISSPRSINAFLQRVGRSGHAVIGTPKGRLFPLSRDDLVECTALLDSVRRGELDRLKIPQLPLDVLAQQIVAEVAARDCGEQELYELIRRAYPFRALTRESFDAIVRMLAEGFTTRRGRQGALLYHDAINHMLRGRKGARLTAITSGGAIPDTADYQVMLEPEGHLVGTVNEDFAVESLAGDVFQLGNASYRILRVERSTVRVEDAHGAAPTIPFWLGEAPGRTDELSAAVSRLRQDVQARLSGADGVDGRQLAEGKNADADVEQTRLVGTAHEWLAEEVGIGAAAAAQLIAYLAAAHAALGCLPTQQTVVFERFFDEAGGMQLVIHSPFGSRINRAWGLALRKRFCRTFNFELQAAATEDTIILSLTTAHSFELADVARYLHPNTAREILVQALLAAPMFTTRWRWDASIALALPRFRGGKKVPAPLARMNAEDLLAAVFPDQVACGENLTGDIVVPDHPLVQQTVRDCLEEAMDVDGFERLLAALIAQQVRVEARDLTEPSPLALEVLSARPYAYLDDAPLEERRTQAVMSRRWIDPESAADIGKLDAQAIARVRSEAWPDAATADELHDALSWLTFMAAEEVQREATWPALIHELMTRNRVTKVTLVPRRLAPSLSLPRFAGEGTLSDTAGSGAVAGEKAPSSASPTALRDEIPDSDLPPSSHEARTGTLPDSAASHDDMAPASGLRPSPCEIKEGTLLDSAALHDDMAPASGPRPSPCEIKEGTLPDSTALRDDMAPDSGPRPFPREAGEGQDGGTETTAQEHSLYIAAERVPLFRAVFADASFEPQVAAAPAATKQWQREEAVREIVRGRLEGLGPTTAMQIATSSGLPPADVDAALLSLEAEGSAMRGAFEAEAAASPASSPTPFRPPIAPGQSPVAYHPSLPQWCDRRLLARIHRYTVKRLRAEIEPIQARDFLRFLFDWQRTTPATRMQGPDAVPAVLAQLEGFDAPAAAWETEILPARIAEYEPAWLDEQCLAGRIVWTRLASRCGDAERGAAPVRSTPIALLARRNVKHWSGFAARPERAQLTPKAQQVAAFIQTHGASFFDEIAENAGLLPTQVEDALAELVALGLVNSDSFGGLRALLIPADRRRPAARDARRRRRVAIFGMQDAGRWALVRKRPEARGARLEQEAGTDAVVPAAAAAFKKGEDADARSLPARASSLEPQASIEHVCRTLLRRWGVVFWKLLEREADWLPPWRDMLMCLRRLEARGEIRGGRFVAGFSGEQFALPDAVGLLRDARRKPHDDQFVSLSAADPLNLIGILTPGARLPSLTGNRVLYRDGLPVALYAGGEVRFLEQLDEAGQWQARNALLRRHIPAPLADLA